VDGGLDSQALYAEWHDAPAQGRQQGAVGRGGDAAQQGSQRACSGQGGLVHQQPMCGSGLNAHLKSMCGSGPNAHLKWAIAVKAVRVPERNTVQEQQTVNGHL
jgi:hypothetical protein